MCFGWLPICVDALRSAYIMALFSLLGSLDPEFRKVWCSHQYSLTTLFWTAQLRLISTPQRADNINFLASDPKINVLTDKLNVAVSAANDWSKRKKLVLAPNKSQVTLFTPWTHESRVHPLVFIDGVLVPLNKNPNNIGNWFDTLFNFGKQSL